MREVHVPPEVEAVFSAFRTGELSTLAKDGTPITWPVCALWQPDPGRFLLTACVGLAQKAANIRRNPHVALLFSDGTGSGRREPPTVLVQGDATALDDIRVVAGLEEYWRMIYERQRLPAYLSIRNSLVRWGTAWCYLRLAIYVVPRRIRWWPSGRQACGLPAREVCHVE